MTIRSSLVPSATLFAAAPLGVLLILVACSSSESSAPDAILDGGGDGDGSGEASLEDAGSDAEEELVTPPPYDFTVACTSDPCVTQIAARGGGHVCAVLQDGSVRCWGSNASGQLGTGGDASSMPGYSASPHAVSGGASAKTVSATGDGAAGTTCVVSIAGAVTCFGSDAWGQLGRSTGGSRGPNPVPAPVVGLTAKSVTLASTFALAIGVDDRLWSWGANEGLQLARNPEDAGVASAAARAELVSGAVRSGAGTSATGFVVTEGGSVLSWGGGTSDQLGRPTSLAHDALPRAIALTDVSSVVTGAAHACALARGRVYCWGTNESGQVGTGRRADELVPARVGLPAGVYAVAVAAGGNDTCVISANGDLYCWGANGSGQVGAAIGQDQLLPTRITGLDGPVVAVGVMDDAICALLRSGSVTCWGDNGVGQLGRGSRDAELHPTPAAVVFP
ncbi:MAG: regulator of chromosome condensation [Labilithrix sp.]|nr:regulator of chromosome condensation [Labilithrix sp.]